ncbi:hypothetical protein TrST_g13194 [Triparma strigata]|uniref:Uncharacterized protein n=1 Tax=Triparma strigata TaxID=1606541 RepID=A0A9W7C1D8_9STRA|nr:hypothetical protein TrST_g13194 [Triparma strigata]
MRVEAGWKRAFNATTLKRAILSKKYTNTAADQNEDTPPSSSVGSSRPSSNINSPASVSRRPRLSFEDINVQNLLPAELAIREEIRSSDEFRHRIRLLWSVSNLHPNVVHHYHTKSIHLGSEGTATSGMLEFLLEQKIGLGKSHEVEEISAPVVDLENDDPNKTVVKKPYIQMLHKLNIFMVPPEVGHEEREKFKKEDWERDSWRKSGNGKEVEYDAFEDSWFELADNWVEVLDKAHYVDFIKAIYEGISKWQTTEKEGTRVWKEDDDIFFSAAMFGDQKALDENDPILKTHNMGEGSLDDLPSLFAGKFDFHAITPYSSARILDCILDIYEARIVSMTAVKEKHKMKLLRCLSTHTIAVNEEMKTFQEFIVDWFTMIYSSRAAVLMSEIKAFIVGCFYHDHPRIKIFKYFFSQSTVEGSKPDRTSALNHAMNLIAKVFPNLHLRVEFMNRTETGGSVYVNKTDFMDAFHHSVPHVPMMAASYQQFLFELASMITYKHPDTGAYHLSESHEGRAIYAEDKRKQKIIQQSYKAGMKKVGADGVQRANIISLTEYVSFEDVMGKCLRVWDLEDDYLQVSKVQGALYFLQCWFRKHKRLHRRKTQMESSRKLSGMRVAGQMAQDIESLKKTRVEQRESISRSAFFKLEGEDNLDEEEQGLAVTTPRNVSITPKNSAGLNGSFGWANQPTPHPTPRAGSAPKAKATKSAGIAAQVQSQNESPSKAERDAAVKKGVYQPHFLKKKTSSKKESSFVSLNGSQVAQASPSSDSSPKTNNFFAGVSATDKDVAKRESAVKFQQSQMELEIQRQEDFIMEAEKEASTMLAMEREARQLELERLQKQDIVATELKEKQKKERQKQIALKKRAQKGAVRGKKLSLRVGNDGSISTKQTDLVSFGAGGSSLHFEADFGTAKSAANSNHNKKKNDVYGLMFEAPGLREMPERIGISSSQGKRPPSSSSLFNARNTQQGTTDDGGNWAATNKAPGRPATAGNSNGGRWSKIEPESFLAMRPSTVNANKSPRQRRQQQQQLLRKHREDRYNGVSSSSSSSSSQKDRHHHQHHHRKNRHLRKDSKEGVEDPAKTLSMQVTANKLYNPVQMAGYY